MGIEINQNPYQAAISNSEQYRQIGKESNKKVSGPTDEKIEKNDIKEKEQSLEEIQESFSLEEFENYLTDIKSMTNALNRDLEFNIDRETDQIFVKIINKSTDEVVRELPAEDLRNLHKKMKEAIEIVGLFVDEQA
ncbi:MAG: flagellar protein FlaG [Spirochaetales bacterium]|nr:flagellar protein FlaG [Spirochaetales bacterium]